MSTSPRLSQKSQTTSRKRISAPMLLVLTALDTTWRAFVPTIGGTFLGIGLDRLFSASPIFLILALILGVSLSVFLITRQLIAVRRAR